MSRRTEWVMTGGESRIWTHNSFSAAVCLCGMVCENSTLEARVFVIMHINVVAVFACVIFQRGGVCTCMWVSLWVRILCRAPASQRELDMCVGRKCVRHVWPWRRESKHLWSCDAVLLPLLWKGQAAHTHASHSFAARLRWGGGSGVTLLGKKKCFSLKSKIVSFVEESLSLSLSLCV